MLRAADASANGEQDVVEGLPVPVAHSRLPRASSAKKETRGCDTQRVSSRLVS